MSAKSKSSPSRRQPTSKSPTKPKKDKKGLAPKATARQFAPEVWQTAQQAAAEYQIILSSDAGEWYGRGLELPHVLGGGESPDECIADTRAALAAAVAYLLEQGRVPPAPARAGRRSQQVNVRLTAAEKVLLEGAARRKGYQGLSDYIRAVVLESVR